MTSQKSTLDKAACSKWRSWWRAARPPFYIATLVPLFVGYSIAGNDTGVRDVQLFVFILLACFFLHLAANLSNDYYDHLSGVDTEETIGGSKAIQEGAITLQQYKVTLVILYMLAGILACIGVFLTGRVWIFAIITFAMFTSHFYVAPPIRFGYRALGEVFVFFSMGLTMTVGSYYALTGMWSMRVFALSFPIGAMVAGILYFQSLPEIETDKKAGKYTLANTLGATKAEILFRWWWPIIWVMLIALWLFGACSWEVIIGILLSVPLHVKACKKLAYAHTSGEWLALDAYGGLVRAMYLFCGGSLVFAVV